LRSRGSRLYQGFVSGKSSAGPCQTQTTIEHHCTTTTGSAANLTMLAHINHAHRYGSSS
jgi:hypothetical protein